MPEIEKSNRDNVLAALREIAAIEKMGAICYPMLLGFLRGRGIRPYGMNPILDGLEREGLIAKKTSQGERWQGFGDDQGPAWVHLLTSPHQRDEELRERLKSLEALRTVDGILKGRMAPGRESWTASCLVLRELRRSIFEEADDA